MLDALSFLREHFSAMDALAAQPDVTAVLDFGLWQEDLASPSVRFPRALVALAGELGLGLEASLYAAGP